MHPEGKDEFVEARLKELNEWIAEGKMPFSPSKIIPVSESLSGLQWVLPTQQAIDILRNMRTFALGDCACRTHYKRCNNPIEVCIRTNDTADKLVAEGKARYISLDEAEATLRAANEKGLIHLAVHTPKQHIYAICSCCECCCTELQLLRKCQRPDLIAHADYVAEVDNDKCIQCGACVKRCVLGAQEQDGKSVVFHQDKCYGCGLCVTKCPTHAIYMRLRQKPINQFSASR
jgi:Pyruvate/2-oxoacid:ferredoxin oxidoreductase delta subunit